MNSSDYSQSGIQRKESTPKTLNMLLTQKSSLVLTPTKQSESHIMDAFNEKEIKGTTPNHPC